MHRTPYQTLLAERLQSAKGLGWDFAQSGVEQPGAVWTHASNWAAECWALWPNLLRWFRFAR